MSEFPLFPLLKTEAGKIPDLTKDQEAEIVRVNETLSLPEHEFVYVLIKMHQLQFGKKGLLELPYSGKYVEGRRKKNNIERESGVEFDVRDFPMELKKILYLYMTKKKLG